MKKVITATILALAITSTAYAADDKTNMQSGVMKTDDCQNYMKDGKMMENTPKDIMDKCQSMMKSNNTNQALPTTKSGS